MFSKLHEFSLLLFDGCSRIMCGTIRCIEEVLRVKLDILSSRVEATWRYDSSLELNCGNFLHTWTRASGKHCRSAQASATSASNEENPKV